MSKYFEYSCYIYQNLSTQEKYILTFISFLGLLELPVNKNILIGN